MIDLTLQNLMNHWVIYSNSLRLYCTLILDMDFLFVEKLRYKYN